MNLHEFLKNTEKYYPDGAHRTAQHIRPHITCADGFHMSVQGSYYHYCEPRRNGGVFHLVEVGFPSERTEELMEYAEEPDKPTETIYGYVPVEIVQAVIDRHGGIKS